MTTQLEALQALLRELFQLDLADLDFGLYRLFHLRQREIEQFITQQLPREVDAAFSNVTAADLAQARHRVEELAAQVRQYLGYEALLAGGDVAEGVRNTPLAQRYTEARRRLAAIEVTEAHKTEVYNHLVSFFRRYYEDGDFIPRRRYGASEAYAVPYNGEEVFFHWANRDQHYVKTTERLRDYAFRTRNLLGEYRVRFVLTEASIPKDNTKGSTRFFFPRTDLVAYDAERRELTVPFEYRLPTPEEAERHGANSKAQEAILAEALPAILEAVPEENLRNLLREDQRTEEQRRAGEPEQALLLRRLRHFCRRSTSDFFIHKDLRGFLARELEFYIKDQVLHVLDLEADEVALDAKRRMLRAFRALAGRLIEFLSAIEDAEKALFEKRKFVLETDYLIPLQHVPRGLWPEVLANAAQQEEWRAWYGLQAERNLLNPEGAIDEAFVAAHPTLPVHTRHFSRDWVRRLLEALPFDDLDEATDGLLVHGENYQALNLLLERYRHEISCVHIDPPYNTETSGFLYKNCYQHSSWLAMMEGRISLAVRLLSAGGSLLCHIDENERERLQLLLDRFALPDAGTVVWDKRNPMNAGRGVALQHEYVMWRSAADSPIYVPAGNAALMLQAAADIVRKHGGATPEARREYAEWVDSNSRLTGGERAYRHLDEFGRVYQSVSLRAPEPRADPKFHQPLIHPVTGKPCAVPPNGFSRTPETLRRMVERGEIIFGPDESTQPRQKVLLTEDLRRQLSSVIQDARRGKSDLSAMGLDFPYCHPVSLYQVLVSAGGSGFGAMVLDFFAGSGTTGHAVINLNREDGGRRKFILVEVADYFDTVLLPRIAKVMYTPEWKEGRPRRLPTAEEAARTPRIVKILRLESYEDALHNLVAPSTLERAAAHEGAYRALAGEEYMLRYWIELPLREAETCLRAFDLAHPFRYSLEVLTDAGPVRKPVDLVETFNWLYGLRVRRYETWRDAAQGEREYRVVRATDREGRRRILVLWRDMEGLSPERERAFLEARLRDLEASGEHWDEVLINGDSPTPAVRSLDADFKRLMMQGEAV